MNLLMTTSYIDIQETKISANNNNIAKYYVGM